MEKDFNGVRVQQAHKILGRRKREWPTIAPPADVMATPACAERDAAIDRCCEAVWAECSSNRAVVVKLLEEFEIA